MKTQTNKKKESRGPSKTELWIERDFKIHKKRGIENRLRFGTILATFLGAKVSTILLVGVFYFGRFSRSKRRV